MKDEAELYSAALRCDTLRDIERLLGYGLNWIDSKRGFDRYAIGDEESTWVCTDCGGAWQDPDQGCNACGFGSIEEIEDELCI